MLLSVITPTLNSRPLLACTIDSVVSQGRDDLEHLIIDGGSSDGTLEFIKKYNHLKLISEPDEGIYDAMNKGIGAASGEWIYFLGAGDYFADERVLSDLEPILDGDADVVYGDVFNARMGKRYDGPFDAVKIRRKNICHQAIFCRRRVFDLLGPFDRTYQGFADWDHNMRWMLNPNVRKEYVDRQIAVYASRGFSFLNPDLQFRRDRLYRYLSYGRGELPVLLFVAVWGKELALGVRHLDLARIRRAISLAWGS